MLVSTQQLDEKAKVITILGNEEWLDPIYGAFPSVALNPLDSKEPPVITGKITFTKNQAELIEVKGSLSYQPKIPCDRCTAPLTVDLSGEFLIYFQAIPEYPDASAEFDLSAMDLEEYHLDKDGCVDVFTLINDQLNLKLPTKIVPGSDGIVAFHECDPKIVGKIKEFVGEGSSLGSERSGFSQDPEEEKESPFSVLAQLRDKLKN